MPLRPPFIENYGCKNCLAPFNIFVKGIWKPCMVLNDKKISYKGRDSELVEKNFEKIISSGSRSQKQEHRLWKNQLKNDKSKLKKFGIQYLALSKTNTTKI